MLRMREAKPQLHPSASLLYELSNFCPFFLTLSWRDIMPIFLYFLSFKGLSADSRRLCPRTLTWRRRETCSLSSLCAWMEETCGVNIGSAHLIWVMRIRKRYLGSMESPLLSCSFTACWASTCKEVFSQWVYARNSGWVADLAWIFPLSFRIQLVSVYVYVYTLKCYMIITAAFLSCLFIFAFNQNPCAVSMDIKYWVTWNKRWVNGLSVDL